MKIKQNKYLILFFLILLLCFSFSFLNLYADETTDNENISVPKVEVKMDKGSGKLKFSEGGDPSIIKSDKDGENKGINSYFNKIRDVVFILFGSSIFFTVGMACILAIKMQFAAKNPTEKQNLKIAMLIFLLATALLGSSAGITAYFWNYF